MKNRTVNQNSGWAALTDYPANYPDTIPIHPNSMNRKGFQSTRSKNPFHNKNKGTKKRTRKRTKKRTKIDSPSIKSPQRCWPSVEWQSPATCNHGSLLSHSIGKLTRMYCALAFGNHLRQSEATEESIDLQIARRRASNRGHWIWLTIFGFVSYFCVCVCCCFCERFLLRLSGLLTADWRRSIPLIHWRTLCGTMFNMHKLKCIV